ncbi:hypothetical protein [Chitiniphilus eburneus]|uniref:hypothetical protein n=1 Tax=Chitiniphilus eburneus TaxID=2571148 RepID=UPI0035D0AE5C
MTSQYLDNNFAEACFRQNSFAELTAALTEPADQTDMANWGITASEWLQQIEIARYAKIADDFALWTEYFDTDGAMGEDEFDSLTLNAKIALQLNAYH